MTNNMGLSEYQKAEVMLRSHLRMLKDGSVSIETVVDYLTPALSDASIKGLSEDYDMMHKNLNELENKS